LLIAFPNADDPPSGNHESLESKIPKRKKVRPNTRLSCKIEYFIQTTSAYLSGRSAFFTDDYGCDRVRNLEGDAASGKAVCRDVVCAKALALSAVGGNNSAPLFAVMHKIFAQQAQHAGSPFCRATALNNLVVSGG
jgi:hypothetical protein